MWQKIAEDLEATLGIKKTYIQCENRYKTILKENAFVIKIIPLLDQKE